MKDCDRLESEYSAYIHNNAVALLVSSQLLRRRGMGQVDVAWFLKKRILIAECKSGHSILSFQQRARLRSSLFFLGSIFGSTGTLIKVQSLEEFAKASPSAYSFKVSKIMELT